MPQCVQVLCELFMRCKIQKVHYERYIELLKRLQKMRSNESCLPMKKFSISRVIQSPKWLCYAKSCYEAKDPKGSEGSSTPTGNGLVGSFILKCNRDSFFRCECKNNWLGLWSHIKRSLTTCGENHIRGWRWVILSAGFCIHSQSDKLQKW